MHGSVLARLFALVVAGAVFAGGCEPVDPDVGTTPSTTTPAPGTVDFSAVSACLETAVEAGALPAVGLSIIDEGGVLYRSAFGTTVDTAELIASATKLASATAIMSLVDDGLVALDDTVAQHLPYFEDAKGDITIRQLLSQQHGLPANHRSIPPPGGDNRFTLAEAVELIAEEVTPVRSPGTAVEYAPAVSYHILGRIAEVVTGQSWSELFEARVAGPLDMGHTTYGATDNPRIGGGIATSLEDYEHLLQMHLRGGAYGDVQVLSAASVTEMQVDATNGLPFLRDPNAAKPEIGYGLTWWVDAADADGTATQLSVPGAYGAIPWINLPDGYAAFLLTKDTLAHAVPVWETILPHIHAALAGHPSTGCTAEPAPA